MYDQVILADIKGEVIPKDGLLIKMEMILLNVQKCTAFIPLVEKKTHVSSRIMASKLLLEH
jgi:hypothetical protein